MSFRTSAADDDELIHLAVRQGHCISLQIYLTQNPECLNKLFTFNQSRWTPLLAACYYRHEHIVRMLLNRFQPDLEMTGTIVFDLNDNQQEIVEEVSPLWTAVAVDHFDIVRLLVEQGGANINHLTKTRSSTFRVACFNDNLAMGKYLVERGANPHQIKVGQYTNLMLSAGRRYPVMVRYLVEDLQANVNDEDENGQTALYYAVRSGSGEIVRFLLDHGARNVRDKLRNVTPLMRAALYGETDLVDVFAGYCSDLEWIEARELLGATFSGCVARLENVNKTTRYLTEALELRAEKSLPKDVCVEPSAIFDFRSECQTVAEFNDVIRSNCKEKVYIEAIRIHQRLLGDKSNDYHHVLRYYGAVLADTRRYNDCLRWWFYEIELKQKYSIAVKKEYLRCFINIFVEMKQNGQIEIPVDSLLTMLKVMQHELRTNATSDCFDYSLRTLLYLLTIVAQMFANGISEMPAQRRRELFQLLRTIVQTEDYRSNKDRCSLLHLCATSATKRFSEEITYPCSLTARLLISCGANADALDAHRNTPLHLVVQNDDIPERVMPVVDILRQAGAHMDHVNGRGRMPVELVASYETEVLQHLKETMGVRPLKCLCARKVQKEGLWHEAVLAKTLIAFVQKH